MGGSSWSRPPAAVARLARLFAAIESGEAAAMAQAVEAEMPPSVRNSPAGWAYLRQRVEQLQQDGLAPELDTLWREPALPSLEPLRAVTAAVLVIGCVGDEVHPVSVAERLAGVFPQATLHVYDRPAVLWTNRQELRERISGFLNAPTP
jgi:3-oxoadipate enol-lactonase